MTWFDSTSVLIGGIGAATPIGRSVWSSAAAVRAGVTGFAKHPYMVDAVGLPMQVASLPWIGEDRAIVDRIGDALVASLREAMECLPAPLPPAALLINLPPSRPGMPDKIGQHIDRRVRDEFPNLFERIGIALLGHAGGAVAMQSALQWLQVRPGGVCVVAGADSYLEPDLLEWLEQTEQLHGAGERNNAWGFVPGEGAAALMLATAETLNNLALTPLARVRNIGVGHESKLIGTGSVCTAVGLTEAVRVAVAPLQSGELLSDVYCDMNGEPYRADEYAFLVTRTREHFASASDFMAPADCWGDVGAATVPLLVTLACVAAVKQYSRGSKALIWASSVHGERGAVLIETASRAG